MNDTFVEYLTTLGMGDVLLNRVAAIERLVVEVSPEIPTHIFVSDYLNQENQRQFQNLYFLTPGYLVEVKNFVTEQAFEFDQIRSSIKNFHCSPKEFDFRRTTPRSELSFRYSTGDLMAELHASGENCLQLLRVIRECFLPNLRGPASAPR